MTDQPGWAPPGVDSRRANTARVYDYWLGGSHNFLADQDLGRAMAAIEPNVRVITRANRAFLGRAVRFLAANGIRQFHDIGSGIPTQAKGWPAKAEAPGPRFLSRPGRVFIAEGSRQETIMTSNDAPAVQAGPDSAIRALFDEVASAWEQGDTDAFVARYADDATAILPGFYLPGKDAIRASMAAAFAGALKGSRRLHEVRSIRHLGDSTAIVITDSTTVFPGGGGCLVRPGRTRNSGSGRRGSCPGGTAGGSSRPTTAARNRPPDRARARAGLVVPAAR